MRRTLMTAWIMRCARLYAADSLSDRQRGKRAAAGNAQRAAQYIKIPMAGQVEVAQRRDGVSSTDVRGSEAAAVKTKI